MKNHILVAGVDYEFKSGVDFRIFCNNRMKRLIASGKTNEDLSFQIFDVRKGEVVTHKIMSSLGKRTEQVAALSPPFKSISQANYERVNIHGEVHHRFRDGQSGTMSILDIYKAVQKVGVDAPGTLAELSFFSHAWMGGPILVNSYDDGFVRLPAPPGLLALPSGARDPDDMDPRASKDFIPPTQDAVGLLNFQRAFHADGFVWIWGCAFPRLVHEILHKIEHHSAYKDHGLGDDVVFELNNLSTPQADMLEQWLRPELGLFPDKKKIVLAFKFIKYFFRKVTASSYAHHIARSSKAKTYGGVMGTYSEYDKGTLPLMNVYSGFSKHLAFYKNYLGFDFDPEGRRYGKYDPAFACTPP